MIDIQTMFDKFKLNASDIDELKGEARFVAIDCGKECDSKKLQPKTWDLFDEMADSVWYSDMTIATKIDLGFNLYEYFPSYYHFLTPFYHAFKGKEINDPVLKDIIWKKFMNYLGSEQFYADPVGYVLWVDFFEDPDTVKEAWLGLIKYSKNSIALHRLIESAGPVPFELKEPVYLKLLKDCNNHESIFNSLLFSAFDVCGQIDLRKAGIILSKLKVKTTTENYKLLLEKTQNHTHSKIKPV